MIEDGNPNIFAVGRWKIESVCIFRSRVSGIMMEYDVCGVLPQEPLGADA